MQEAIYDKPLTNVALVLFLKSLEVKKLGLSSHYQPKRNYRILPDGKYALYTNSVTNLIKKVWQRVSGFEAVFRLGDKPVLEVKSNIYKYKLWLQDIRQLTWHDCYEDYKITSHCKDHNPVDYKVLLKEFRYINQLGEKAPSEKSLVICSKCDCVWATQAGYVRDLSQVSTTDSN